jgi:hypothetical protein
VSWSYSGDPAHSAVDKYRFILGDTNTAAPLMQDEEIQYIVDTSNGNENVLLYTLFIRAATLFARDIKRQLGPQSEDPTERLKFYHSQAAMYKGKLSSAGLSIPNYAHPKIFRVGMNNNPPYPPYPPYPVVGT